ncbi:MAG: hypothetical protein JWQ86_2735 [Mycobacterium sp.]|nr:hypothetical protein [Mycobacterium sp.]
MALSSSTNDSTANRFGCAPFGRLAPHPACGYRRTLSAVVATLARFCVGRTALCHCDELGRSSRTPK